MNVWELIETSSLVCSKHYQFLRIQHLIRFSDDIADYLKLITINQGGNFFMQLTGLLSIQCWHTTLSQLKSRSLLWQAQHSSLFSRRESIADIKLSVHEERTGTLDCRYTIIVSVWHIWLRALLMWRQHY